MSTGEKILVIDNETDQLAMMREILGRLGYAVTTADTPEAAVALARQHPFDVILIDLIMPDIEGTELCEQIRQHLPDSRIIAFSGHIHLYSKEQLSRAGFDGMLRKPASIEELRTAIEACGNKDPGKKNYGFPVPGS